MKDSDGCKAEFFVKSDAVGGQIFILPLGAGYAGVDVSDSLSGKTFFKRFIELSPDSEPLFIPADIDRGFNRPVVCRSALESRGIGIADGFSVKLRNKIRIFFLNFNYPLSEFLSRRNGAFKSYRRFLNIGRIDCKQFARIFRAGKADFYFIIHVIKNPSDSAFLSSFQQENRGF